MSDQNAYRAPSCTWNCWLSPNAASGPRTTSKAALDAEKEQRTAKADAAKAAKAKAQESRQKAAANSK